MDASPPRRSLQHRQYRSSGAADRPPHKPAAAGEPNGPAQRSRGPNSVRWCRPPSRPGRWNPVPACRGSVPRRTFLRQITVSLASTACIWKMDLARSRPIVVISMVDGCLLELLRQQPSIQLTVVRYRDDLPHQSGAKCSLLARRPRCERRNSFEAAALTTPFPDIICSIDL